MMGRTLGVLALLMVLGSGLAWADEPPAPVPPPPPVPEKPKDAPSGDPLAPEEGFPEAAPANEKTEAPKEAPAEPATDDVWTPPIKEATRQPTNDMLPDPVVRDPRTGRQTGGTPAARTAAMPTTGFPTMTPRMPPTTPAATTAGARPTTTAAPATAARVARGQIEKIAKVHNQPLQGVGPALRLDVDFSARQLRGQDLYVAAWFVRKDTGNSIKPLLAAYADGKGRLSSQTQSVRITTDGGRYSASLWVPYGAFPAPEMGSSYDVEVQVLLLSRGNAGRDTVLSRSSTTFTVHGAE